MGGTMMAEDQVVKVPRFRRGLPMVPPSGSDVNRRVLDHVAETSKQFGTVVDIDGDVGVVKIGGPVAAPVPA
jgi:hypothetical protein